MTRVFWLMRATAYVAIGLLALINPPTSHPQRAVQIACFAMIGAALLANVYFDIAPRYRAYGVPVSLGVMAVGGGLAAATTGGGQTLVVFAAIAAMVAGTDIEMPIPIVIAAAGMLPIWIAGPFTHSTLGTLGGYPALLISCVLWGRNRRSYRVQAEQAAALLEQHKRLQAEQRRVDVLDERSRIAREIHDVLAHSLGALGIQIQSAKSMLTDQGDVGRAVEALSTAQRIAADGLTETRRAVHALRVDSLPLAEELAGVVDTHQQSYRVPVTFETSGTVRPLPPDASLALLRAGQEALVNAAKHAPGQQVTVHLDYTDTGVRLAVVNHTSGAVVTDRKPGLTGGYGLTGMGERLRLLNGTLQAGPRDNEWAVTAEIPIAAEDVIA
ncbi:MAG TPA: histidine kinase [Streptosporangiaceae bacterium]|jgi:signal transduction histidine kinase